MPERRERLKAPYVCPRCQQLCPVPHPLADCVHNIAVYNQKKRTALHVVADYVSDLRRNWPRYSAQEQQLVELCKALHIIARELEDDTALPGN